MQCDGDPCEPGLRFYFFSKRKFVSCSSSRLKKKKSAALSHVSSGSLYDGSCIHSPAPEKLFTVRSHRRVVSPCLAGLVPAVVAPASTGNLARGDPLRSLSHLAVVRT